MNIKGHVKSLQTYYSKINENLPKKVKNEIKVNNAAIWVYKYLELYKNGHPKISISNIPDFGLTNLPFKGLNVDIYNYENKDLEKKEAIKSGYRKYNQNTDYFILLKPNVDRYYFSKVLDDSSVLIDQKNLIQDLYVYNYDSKGRIKEELQYVLNPSDTIPLKKYNPKYFDVKILFFYNDKDQVISQKIVSGPENEEQIKSHSFDALNTEYEFCSDLQLKYKYDNQGRMAQALLYGDGKTISKEDYIYHATKDYVEKVKFYVSGAGEISNPTKNFVKTYNEQGDMIEKEFILDFPEQTLDVKKLYYTYEYDNHNNWIKCNMFLEGTPDGEPTLVAERKIEYYN
ncbi:hypothetical protein [Flavobacterium aquiphilum]|uniref:hypothetical protein n=1 Tax=Flavobacterium aquiphilum TaxID=3003261 RepID=UPI0024819381|nr:hypothetical protein [Flavobacterium aquiphilum]